MDQMLRPSRHKAMFVCVRVRVCTSVCVSVYVCVCIITCIFMTLTSNPCREIKTFPRTAKSGVIV